MKSRDEIIKKLNRIDIEIEKIRLQIYEKRCKSHEYKALENRYNVLIVQKAVLEWVLDESNSEE